jgi:hypothetical protein
MREGIWEKSRGTTEADIKKNELKMKRILAKFNKIRAMNK